MTVRRRIAPGAVALGVAVALAPAGATAQTAEAFFANKPQMRMLVSSTAGGGYDFFGRIVARYFTKHMPGNPQFVVQNMPGGGGVTASNYLYTVAAKDGTVMGIIDRGIPTAQLLYGKDSQTQFEPTKFQWIGSMATEIGVGLISTKAPAKTIADLKVKEVSFGANGLETDPAMYARLVNALAGTKIKTVVGYPGQTEYYLAMQRGETDGLFMSGWSGPNRQQALRDVGKGELRYFVQMAKTPHPDFGDTPMIMDLATDPKDKQIVEILLSRLVLGRPFLLPAEVPADRVAMLRKMFRQTAEDPEFKAEVDKAGNRIDPVFGEEAQATIQKLYATPPDVLERMRSIVQIKK